MNLLAVKVLLILLCLSLFLNFLILRSTFVPQKNTSIIKVEQKVVYRNTTKISSPSVPNTLPSTSSTPSSLPSPSVSPSPQPEQPIKIYQNTTCPKKTIKKRLPKVGNIANDEIFTQSKERRVRIASKPVMLDVPSFTQPKILGDGDVNISLNNRLVSSTKVFDMIILIPTLARINSETGKHADYLITVLMEYKKQLKSSSTKQYLSGKSILFIIYAFINEKTHTIFQKAAKKFGNVAEFVFFVPPFRFKDFYSDIPGVKYSAPNNGYPGKMARQQTCDTISMTKFIIDNFKFKYLLYTEDDFQPCENMLVDTLKNLDRIEQYHEQKQFRFEKGFCAMRISIGLGGFIVSKHYATLFLAYAKNNIELEPVDILIHFISFKRGEGYTTCLDDGLTHYSSTLSYLQHIGHESNWKERNDKKVFGGRDIKCKDSLGEHHWHVGNKFGVKEESRNCKQFKDIKPCVGEYVSSTPTLLALNSTTLNNTL